MLAGAIKSSDISFGCLKCSHINIHNSLLSTSPTSKPPTSSGSFKGRARGYSSFPL